MSWMPRLLRTGLSQIASLLAIGLISAPSLAQPSFFPAAEPLKPILTEAQRFERELQRQDRTYSQLERRILLSSSQILLNNRQCRAALNLFKESATGTTVQSVDSWRLMAEAAQCAKDWSDAVNASALYVDRASHKGQRAGALRNLGKALEAHWRYDDAIALSAYQAATQLSAGLHGVQERIDTLSRRVAQQRSLRVTNHYVDTAGSSPALCISFNRSIEQPGDESAPQYANYIRTLPQIEGSFRREGSQTLCVEGAAYGAEYVVRVLPDLPAIEAETRLKSLRALDFNVGDRPAKVWFANSRYVLPRQGQVPIHSINLDRARLTLYRVDERNLQSAQIRERFRADLDRHQAEALRNQLGQQLWSGVADLHSKRNEEAVTALPLGDLVKPEAGLYVLTAQPATDEEHYELATQWLVVSDLGLTSYQGSDGLTVGVRSLTSALPLPGVKLVLTARNNRQLAEAITNDSGMASFAKGLLRGQGGLTASSLMAFTPGGDFNFLDITKAPFDLSDRGVRGRPAPGPLDAYLYTERGVYRPGESVNLVALLRDDIGHAIDGLPLTLRVVRSDEKRVTQVVLKPQGVGGYSYNLPLPRNARTGRWKASVHVNPDAAAIGQVAFQVEQIVPPRIEVAVNQAPEQVLLADETVEFAIQADYLFGAPAADLPTKATLRIERDPEPFPDFKDYRFGPVDEPEDAVLLPLADGRTSEAGRATFSATLERLPKLNSPMRGRFRAEVTDVDGRAVAASHWVKVNPQAFAIGIKAPEGGRIAGGSEAAFHIQLLNRQGQPEARAGLHYRLIEEETNYQWYRDQGRWRFKRQVRDILLKQAELRSSGLNSAADYELRLPLDYGSYRLEVKDPTTGILSSVRVDAGWAAPGPDTETPDRLAVIADQPSYQPGQKARIKITAPFTGPASLVIATDRVLETRNLYLPTKEEVVELHVDPLWGAGAYVMISAYRPDAGANAGKGPRRAVGLTWLALDPASRGLQVAIDAPERAGPNKQQMVRVTVSGQAPEAPLFLTLAAVDEGVLQLTGFDSPDPLKHYMGQRDLGLEMRDLYGRLIDGYSGEQGRIRSGSGADGRRGMPDSHIEILSLFSGIVTPDDQGEARIPLDLPEFSGKLRLMAVAWSPDRVGASQQPIVVRDPVVVQASLPRFLANGDRSQATLKLHNLEAPAGEYQLSWDALGALQSLDTHNERALSLAPGDRAVIKVLLEAKPTGDTGRLALSLTGPDGKTLNQEIKVGLRPAYLPIQRRRLGHLAPDSAHAIGKSLSANLIPQSLEATLSISPTPELGIPALLKRLDLYPYGCAEQLTSRAFPLLHLQSLKEKWNFQPQGELSARLRKAILQLLEKQLQDGSFSLWGGRSGAPWVSVYAMDFLGRARGQEIEVPEFAWQRGLEWLRRQTQYPELHDNDAMAVQSYALYVLARAGIDQLETARYLMDKHQNLPSGLAAAHLGGALYLSGDLPLATEAFRKAERLDPKPDLNDYGSRLRDTAARLLVETEVTGRPPAQAAEAIARLREDLSEHPWLSTQEQAWLIRMADALTDTQQALKIELDGTAREPHTGPLVLNPTPDALREGLSLKNSGEANLWYALNLTGSPSDAPPPEKQGLSIERKYYHLDGTPADPSALKQGDLFVVELTAQALTQGHAHQLLVVDPLPAGLEAENANLANSRAARNLHWLGQLSNTLYTEALDDRYVAALDLPRSAREKRRQIRLAYLVRAVSPGHYHADAPRIEDMYKPRFRGRGETGSVRVWPAEE